MSKTIDYYLAPQSPWTYLGHQRFAVIAKAAGATINLMPTDLGKVFAVSGGLPLAKRPAQRQAYRLVELRRFADHLGVTLHLQPAFFPVAGDTAARLIIAVDQHDGTDAAMALAGKVLSGVWADQRNIADAPTLGAMLGECGLPARRLDDAQDPAIQQRYDANTQKSIDAGIFGAPTYLIDGEMFWGQDRLDFVERRLAQA
ncbi:MAG: 2-hydroxychromene-2-carboxylate isomerase [Pseudomonadota bacterium]|nr:2-hydroxychromene-2-carboxylate isomerase [Pseudomonadota bacterium]